MTDRRPIPTGAIAPSLLAADFARLEQQVTTVMDAGARVIHVDVMDGHFVPPITIGALIVDALRELVHGRGGILDCHLMVERPERHVEAFVAAGADVITVHPEATPHIHYTLKLIRETDYLERTISLGERLRAGLDEVAGRHGFGLRQTGPAQLPLIMVDDDPTGAKGYFWTNALLKRGVYFHPWHSMFITTAMTDADIDHAIQAADDAFKLLKAAGDLEPVAKLEFMHSLVD